MTRRAIDREDPDRLYTVTGGRSRAPEGALDLVALVVAEDEPAPGMQSEHARILQLCRRSPVAVVELSAALTLPVTVVKILLADLLDAGRITLRHPSSTPGPAQLPDLDTLKQVLLGLQKL
ncbi:DUF742 domain-containing protein [Spirillospora sp. NPDC047279]|uniref:DUF742 domain-containing protein n=1 Tax=Spirillospora sp. NPDC047279 TaxID=3155478 RepID=UPI0033E8F80D